MSINTTSSDPAVVLGPAKAVAAFIATPVVAFLGALGTALTDNEVTGQEWVTIAIATILATGLVGTATYVTPTRVEVKAPEPEPNPADILDDYSGTGK